jgi:hypothetical protein
MAVVSHVVMAVKAELAGLWSELWVRMAIRICRLHVAASIFQILEVEAWVVIRVWAEMVELVLELLV